jgi:hypothetical protein
MSQQPQELHEVRERRLLGPYKVALLLDNGSLVLMDSDSGTQTVLDAGAADTLLDLLSTHKDFLHQLAQPGDQTAERAHEDWANDE